jgi:hypothetical protein
MTFKSYVFVKSLLVSIHTESTTKKHSHTFVICFAKYFPSSSNGEDVETHYIHLIDYHTFEIISSFSLDFNENGCSIITCSFTDNFNSYYCVRTTYALYEESEPYKIYFISCITSILLLILLLLCLFIYMHIWFLCPILPYRYFPVKFFLLWLRVSCNEVSICDYLIHSWLNFNTKNILCKSMNKELNLCRDKYSCSLLKMAKCNW